VVFCLHPGMCDTKYHTLKQYQRFQFFTWQKFN
jgi:hypothetical protein